MKATLMTGLLALTLTAAALRADPPALMQRLEAELRDGLTRRGVRETFDRYQAYAAGRLDASAGGNRFGDKTGNCRLAFVDWLLRHQLEAPAAAERFTRELHQALASGPQGARLALDLMAQKADAAADPRPAPATLRHALDDAAAACRDAFAPLDEAQRAFLRDNLYRLTTGDVTGGAFWRGRDKARALADVLQRIDRRALHRAAAALAALHDETLLASLADLPAGRTDTPHGAILVGTRGDDDYDLDALADVAVVIDPAGDDTYREGTLTAERPVLIVIDLEGDDAYRGEKPGIQGGAILGASLLIDAEGDDAYDAKDVAQGSCLAGVGLLFDDDGDDTYRALRRAQGQAIAGLALLVDAAGDDTYRVALAGQGVGGPLGVGVLDDLDGDDHYYAGGLYPDSYDDTPGYAGWSQGVGVGPRGAANGGIGVLLDDGGNDVYEADYFSHAGGYWFAAGFARDFAGNDQRLGSTRLAYDGNERAEPVFLRWGVAYGCHYGAGFLFDDQGDDAYGGTVVGQAFAWDIAVTSLCDFAGNDAYRRISSGQGVAREAGLAVMFDAAGDDTYEGDSAASASPKVSYHPLPDCGGNFSFVINLGGTDTYNGQSGDNRDEQRGSETGFLIDR